MRTIILLSVVLLLSKMTLGQDNQNPADFIMRAVIQKALDNDDLKKTRLEYKKNYKIEDLNSREEPIRLKKNEVIFVSNGTEKLIERDDKPIKGASSSLPNINFDNALASFYEYRLDEKPVIMMAGRAYHVINFKPKRNTRPNGDTEKVLALLTGTIYIDVEKLFIYKLNAKLTENYKRGWLIYKLSRADIELKQKEFENLVVVDYFKVIDKYYLFRVETFERRVITYTDYAYKQ